MAEQKPFRVLAVISDKNSYWEQSWLTPEILLPAIEILKDKDLLEYTSEPEMRLIAKEKRQTRVFIVFDISHTSYDAAKGHLPEENKLPVSIVRLGRKLQAYPANGPIQNRINSASDGARAHYDHGIGSIPPLVTDHTLGPPMYTNLRDPSLLLR
ncbi:hypothetical protein N7456_003971 [Penicillium angulare]|uniref:Uncharacterized protein n=1 Tax=Penicillium angulare TaxID=116970 RepID=A0A9W9KIS1_9EURO|nr:hypothetical protein N7456_003971 [Penicillium angulare]